MQFFYAASFVPSGGDDGLFVPGHTNCGDGVSDTIRW
jgi:hypothetical protein